VVKEDTQRKMAVAIQSLSCARFATVGGGTRSFPSQRKPLLFSVTLSSRSRNLYSSIVTASSKKKNKKVISKFQLYSSKFNIIHTSQIPNLYYAFQFFAEKIVSFHRLFQKQQQHQQYQQGYFNFNNIVPIRNTRNVVSPRSLDVVFKMIDFQKD
jgi:hypothetical protein